MLIVLKPSVVKPSVVMPSVVMPSVVMPRVVAPEKVVQSFFGKKNLLDKIYFSCQSFFIETSTLAPCLFPEWGLPECSIINTTLPSLTARSGEH